MGKARLNIWVRDKNCRVIKRDGHLHIYNCLEEQVFGGWVIADGHAEVEMPPGCYIVVAGMQGGNIYSDRTVSIVGCGDEACVNLILPNFEENDPRVAPAMAAPVKLLAMGGCAARLIPALAVHAVREKIDPKPALDVLIKTAKIDRKQLIAAIEEEIKELRENMDRIRKAGPEAEQEAKEYMDSLGKIKVMIG